MVGHQRTMDMTKKIQFIIPNGRKFVVVKTFKDKNHYDNYVSYMRRENRFIFDEVWNVTN
tara:strand:- start:591 stop:770 length:180 start_codon:yes stop_codon:yes gene_type:complete